MTSDETITTIVTIVSALGVVVTALATIFLWRVTRLLATETQRMADAAAQPQVVATIEPSQWAMMYADLVVENTGNSTAFAIELVFDPPLEVTKNSAEVQPMPFQTISVLRPGQQLKSWIGQTLPLIGKQYFVTLSWQRGPTGPREAYTYLLDLGVYEHVSQLKASNPAVQIAEKMKKLQEDVGKLASGTRKLRVDVFSSTDRRSEREELEARWAAEEADEAQTDELSQPDSSG